MPLRLLNRLLKLSLLWLAACAVAPVTYPSHPLGDEIIKVRKGHEGNLTNRSCVTYDANEVCTSYQVKDYALADQVFRDTVNRLDFLCNIGGKRYKICKDKPGFCRIGYTQNCFLFLCNSTEVETDYLPVTNYQFLLDANARCANKEEYNLWSTTTAP